MLFRQMCSIQTMLLTISMSRTDLSELVTGRSPGHQAYRTKIVLDLAIGLGIRIY